ncbi:hypothetical protein ABZ260_24645 [Streptosporangium sp. NPDC006013]|uniref:hypothetical protein n=1 Tax=Streptosporangium sp. NPDC006013 TaxID=3155596 RepID=UPI0033A88B92
MRTFLALIPRTVTRTVLAALREAGWPAPQDPDGSDDELDGRDTVAEHLVD